MSQEKIQTELQETIAVPFRPDEDEPFIFISYSHKDKERIFPIITRLYEKGWHIWYDEGIELNKNYYIPISNHIEKCQLFIIFVTENSVKSTFCIRELLCADKFEKTICICRLDSNAQFTDFKNAITLATVLPRNIETNESELMDVLERIPGLIRFAPRRAMGLNKHELLISKKNDEFEFEVCKDGIRLTKYKGNDETLVIPPEYKQLPVTEIDFSIDFYSNACCEDCVRRIYIPEGVNKIRLIFIKNIAQIFLPSSLKSIEIINLLHLPEQTNFCTFYFLKEKHKPLINPIKLYTQTSHTPNSFNP